MKARTLISILTFIFTLLLISSCATTPKTKEEREVVEVQKLIESGADLNAKDKKGFTALSRASRAGHTEAVKLTYRGGCGC